MTCSSTNTPQGQDVRLRIHTIARFAFTAQHLPLNPLKLNTVSRCLAVKAKRLLSVRAAPEDCASSCGANHRHTFVLSCWARLFFLLETLLSHLTDCGIRWWGCFGATRVLLNLHAACFERRSNHFWFEAGAAREGRTNYTKAKLAGREGQEGGSKGIEEGVESWGHVLGVRA